MNLTFYERKPKIKHKKCPEHCVQARESVCITELVTGDCKTSGYNYKLKNTETFWKNFKGKEIQ